MWVWLDTDNDAGAAAQISGKSWCVSLWNDKLALKSTEVHTDFFSLQCSAIGMCYLSYSLFIILLQKPQVPANRGA